MNSNARCLHVTKGGSICSRVCFVGQFCWLHSWRYPQVIAARLFRGHPVATGTVAVLGLMASIFGVWEFFFPTPPAHQLASLTANKLLQHPTIADILANGVDTHPPQLPEDIACLFRDLEEYTAQAGLQEPSPALLLAYKAYWDGDYEKASNLASTALRLRPAIDDSLHSYYVGVSSVVQGRLADRYGDAKQWIRLAKSFDSSYSSDHRVRLVRLNECALLAHQFCTNVAAFSFRDVEDCYKALPANELASLSPYHLSLLELNWTAAQFEMFLQGRRQSSTKPTDEGMEPELLAILDKLLDVLLLTPSLNDPDRSYIEAEALHRIADVYLNSGRYEYAHRRAHDAARLMGRLGKSCEQAAALQVASRAARATGDTAPARSDASDALAASDRCPRLRPEVAVAIVLGNAAIILQDSQVPQEALAFLWNRTVESHDTSIQRALLKAMLQLRSDFPIQDPHYWSATEKKMQEFGLLAD